MSISTEIKDNNLIIKIKGRFDFKAQAEFRGAYEKAQPSAKFVVDLSQTDYMDSSALGMLLLLHDYAGGDKSQIEIVKCSEDVKAIFAISNFQKLFKIS
ncbi:MAG: STAS domain-containing protein [Gammaproteobacteria bacterium]|nr:STAS domain-containing protein [Gammaproteobacteria bacterium]